MDEAIDYNALSWVRQELKETLKLARVQLEEYAADADNELPLQHCATQLHEALGPLKMVDIKGAVLLHRDGRGNCQTCCRAELNRQILRWNC